MFVKITLNKREQKLQRKQGLQDHLVFDGCKEGKLQMVMIVARILMMIFKPEIFNKQTLYIRFFI